jgi:hypothetical protein
MATQAPPKELLSFPAELKRPTLGYLSIQFARCHLDGPRLEKALETVVFFPDMLQHRTTSCRRLVRTELAFKLAQMQAELHMRGAVVEKGADPI